MFQFLKGAGGLLKVGFILALLGLIAWGSYRGAQHLFLGNEKYALQEIELKTNGAITHTRVVEVAEIDLGASVFAIDIEDIKMRLHELPEVVSCDVERRLPGQIRITLTERVPVAWIESRALRLPGRAAHGILADGEGITFPCVGGIWQSAQPLPVIVIDEAQEDSFTHGAKMKQPDVMRALHLLKSFGEGDIRAQWQPERITLLNSYSMEATCQDGSRAIFGMYDHRRQLSDFVSIHEHTVNTGRQVRHINLIPKINIPVKFSDEQTSMVSPQSGAF